MARRGLRAASFGENDLALPNFEYIAPDTIDELAGALTRFGERARILAGGTDLIILLRERLVRAECLIDIGRLPSLRGIAKAAGKGPAKGITIGAATRIRDLERSTVIRDRYHALYQSAGQLGSPQIRDMATIGGNSCTASPAAETPPSLIALGATVSLVSVRGRRELPLEEFILGTRKTALTSDEFLESFHLPEPWPRSASRYAYAGLRDAMEIDIANVAVNIGLGADGKTIEQVRIAMGAVGPVQLRAKRAEALLTGRAPDAAAFNEAAEACSAEAKPIDDMRASAAYRIEVLKPLVRRTLAEAVAAAGQQENAR